MSDEEIFESYSMFANTFSYLGLPITRDIKSADLVVMGIPYDLGTTGRAGTRHGPQSIRAASANLRWEEKRWPWGPLRHWIKLMLLTMVILNLSPVNQLQ